MSRDQIFRMIFLLAGIYNIAVGLWAVLLPRSLFDALDLGAPSHPAIWACLGMVIGLYGLIYLAVALTDPARRRSAVVLAGRRIEYDVTGLLIGIGLAGKILGPIGFVLAVQSGELPLRMVPLLALNDWIWWTPFVLYLIDGTPIAAALAREAPRIAAVVHVVAAVATLLWIRGGSEAEPDPVARSEFIASNAATWSAAWVIWMIAGVTLIGFYCWWAARSPRPRLAQIAIVMGCAGLAADFFANALFIGWFPERYARVALFTTVVSEVVANGLYTTAGIILMVASSPIRPWFRLWGWIVWIEGIALAVAGAVRWDAAIVVSSGLLLATFIPWAWLARRFLDKPA